MEGRGRRARGGIRGLQCCVWPLCWGGPPWRYPSPATSPRDLPLDNFCSPSHLPCPSFLTWPTGAALTFSTSSHSPPSLPPLWQVSRATFTTTLRDCGSVLMCPGGQAELIYTHRLELPSNGNWGAEYFGICQCARGAVGSASRSSPAGPLRLQCLTPPHWGGRLHLSLVKPLLLGPPSSGLPKNVRFPSICVSD